MNVREALIALAPGVAIQIKANIQHLFKRLVELFGENMRGHRGVANSIYYKQWCLVRQMCEGLDCDRSGSPGRYVLNAEKLEAYAAKAAHDAVLCWEGKINAKLGELEAANVIQHGGDAFMISGERLGRKIAIEQRMIVNVSAKGVLFNQFPARIYVNGKFMSEAAYKKLGG